METLQKEKILSFFFEKSIALKALGVVQIGLFGSYATEEFNEHSDVDILVEFNPSQKNFKNYIDLKLMLEDAFHKKIDLVIKDRIKPRIREKILSETIYAA